MNYFWTHQYELPPGVGYAHGSAAHLLSIAFIAAAVAACLGSPSRARERMIRIVPPLLLAMEIFKDLYLVRTGYFGVGYLPLHLCSMGIPVFLLAVYGGKARAYFTEAAMVLILPGSVAAILFPDWNMYPVWNFMNLYSWVWHGMLVLFPLLIRKGWKADIRNLWKPLTFLAAVVPPVWLLDRKYDCNYLFINWPPAGTPLEWLAGFMGVPGYLAGYAVLTLAVIAAVYFIFYVTGAIGNSGSRAGEK